MENTPASTTGANLPAAKNEMVDQVMTKIQGLTETGLLLPKDYHPENHLRGAWLILQDTEDRNKKPVLDVCTKASIANTLLKMVLLGLNPSKSQCAFVAMGTQLTLMVEYPGKVAIAKRVGLKGEPIANCVYKDDVFEYTIDAATGRKTITKHDQKLANIDMSKLIGAYAVIELEDGRKNTEIMTIAQIKSAWGMGAAKGDSPAHRNFPDQMANKTVISRALKILINSSSDNDLQKIDEEDDDKAPLATVVKAEINDNGNKKDFVFEDANVVPDTPAANAPAATNNEGTPEGTNAGNGAGF